MHAAVLHQCGQPPSYSEFPEPVPTDGEVMATMTAVAVHPVDRARAGGGHYASPHELPAVCGVDGVGRLADGTRVYLGGIRAPFGTMAQRVPVPSWACAPVPDGLADEKLAALVNPGLAAWLPLTWRGRLAPGETVLVLGATGVAGRLAVRLARALGAGRVVAAGRDPAALDSVGADTAVGLSTVDLGRAGPYDLIVDYLWGPPTEALLSVVDNPARLVQVGDGAGPSVALPAGRLRSSGLTISGYGLGSAPPGVLATGFGDLLAHAGDLDVAVDTAPLSEVGQLWDQHRSGRRWVLTP